MKARLVPAIIAGAPAFAFGAIFVSWSRLGLTHAIAGTALTVLFAAFADLARRRGKTIEPKLIERMGGLPTTTTLRHRDDIYDVDTKGDFHAFIAAKLGKPAPTAAEETADPAAADNYYARGATWLRENTRDAKRFGIPAQREHQLRIPAQSARSEAAGDFAECRDRRGVPLYLLAPMGRPVEQSRHEAARRRRDRRPACYLPGALRDGGGRVRSRQNLCPATTLHAVHTSEWTTGAARDRPQAVAEMRVTFAGP